MFELSRLRSFRVWPAFAYTLLILVSGSMPAAAMGVPSLNDKLMHVIGFAGSALLWCRAVRHLRPALSERVVGFLGFLSTLVLGGALELWQSLLSYRSAEWLDWVADGVGGMLAILLRALTLLALGASKAPPA